MFVHCVGYTSPGLDFIRDSDLAVPDVVFALIVILDASVARFGEYCSVAVWVASVLISNLCVETLVLHTVSIAQETKIDPPEKRFHSARV